MGARAAKHRFRGGFRKSHRSPAAGASTVLQTPGVTTIFQAATPRPRITRSPTAMRLSAICERSHRALLARSKSRAGRDPVDEVPTLWGKTDEQPSAPSGSAKTAEQSRDAGRLGRCQGVIVMLSAVLHKSMTAAERLTAAQATIAEESPAVAAAQSASVVVRRSYPNGSCRRPGTCPGRRPRLGVRRGPAQGPLLVGPQLRRLRRSRRPP